MLELWGCFFLIYGMYIPPAIAITLYKPQLLSIWLISVLLATLPLIITSTIYVQVHSTISTSSYVFRASEQTVLLVLSVINVCLQWFVKISMFVVLAKWQHKYAHTVFLGNRKNKQISAAGNSATSSPINDTNNISNSTENNKKLDLEHEVVFWSTRFRTLPLSMTVGAAFGFVSVIASASTQFDLSAQLDHFGAVHLSSYNFEICPQLPSLVHVALQSCLLSFAHIAWGAMTGQVIFALTEIGVGPYWNHYCSISGNKTWGEWWKHSAWRQVHNYNIHYVNSNGATSTTNNETIESNSSTATNMNVKAKENREINGVSTKINSAKHETSSITCESSRKENYCVEDIRTVQREEMESLSLHDSDDTTNNVNNKMHEIENDCKDENNVNTGFDKDKVESTCRGVNTHLFLSSTTAELEDEQEEEEERCHHKHREEEQEESLEEEEEEEEEESPVDHDIGNTDIHNEQVHSDCVSSASNSVFVDDGTHKLKFAIMWLVLYLVVQLVFTTLPIFYHKHGAFDVISMRESNRTGCVVTLPVELVLVTISYIGFVWLVREEEVRNEIE